MPKSQDPEYYFEFLKEQTEASVEKAWIQRYLDLGDEALKPELPVVVNKAKKIKRTAAK